MVWSVAIGSLRWDALCKEVMEKQKRDAIRCYMKEDGVTQQEAEAIYYDIPYGVRYRLAMRPYVLELRGQRKKR